MAAMLPFGLLYPWILHLRPSMGSFYDRSPHALPLSQRPWVKWSLSAVIGILVTIWMLQGLATLHPESMGFRIPLHARFEAASSPSEGSIASSGPSRKTPSADPHRIVDRSPPSAGGSAEHLRTPPPHHDQLAIPVDSSPSLRAPTQEGARPIMGLPSVPSREATAPITPQRSSDSASGATGLPEVGPGPMQGGTEKGITNGHDSSGANVTGVVPKPERSHCTGTSSPAFPKEALNDDVDRGEVIARLFADPSTGEITRVEILSAKPSAYTRYFEREIRLTVRSWRCTLAPGNEAVRQVFRFQLKD